jgi:hypothetical protein
LPIPICTQNRYLQRLNFGFVIAPITNAFTSEASRLTIIPTTGNYAVPNFGCGRIRARMSSYTTGSAAITITRGYTSSARTGSGGGGGAVASSVVISQGGNTASVNGSGQLSIGDGGGSISIDRRRRDDLDR